MRYIRKPLIVIAIMTTLFAASTEVGAQLNLERLLKGASQAAQALTLTDADVQGYVHQYVEYSDSANHKLPAANPYSVRLAKITSGLTSVDGVPLNFAVYQSDEVNAFACADGSVRVYTALLDLMNDEEVLGVIGHEIGHVAHKDSKNAFKQALLNSALLDGLAATSSRVATLTDSQLAQVGNSLLTSKHSRKQEQNADDYGYEFLKAKGKNPTAMIYAFQKLQQIEEGSGRESNALTQLFSSHPDVKKRISRITKMAKKDGYVVK